MFLHVEKETLDSYFDRLGLLQFFDLYNFLQQSENIRFTYSKNQQSSFNEFFEIIQKEYASYFGLDIIASMCRFALIAYRVSMILSALRIMEHGNISSTMVCTNEDYQGTITIIKTLLKHTAKIYQSLMPSIDIPRTSSEPTLIRQHFCDSLPVDFNCKTYLSIAKQLQIAEKTADKYIKSFCLRGTICHEAHGRYSKSVKN